MNISKFLIIDAALLIAVLAILLSTQGAKKESAILRSFRNNELFRKTSRELPEKEKLIKLEKLALSQGSGIKFNSLIGDWKFASVWKKESDEEDAVFSSLLRIFSANINFKKKISTLSSPDFSVIASIEFWLFKIEFSGSGHLKGKQPLLLFNLNLIELKSGSKVLFRRSLQDPEDKEKSYFAIIALEENGTWLSARGQGGAVVIWLRD